MSQYTVQNLKDDVQKKLHGSTPNNLTTSLDEGRRHLLQNIMPEEMVRQAFIEDAIFPSVEQYSPPSDLSYDNIIEISKVSSYHNIDTMQRPLEVVYRRRFDQKRRWNKNIVAITNINGVKYLKISHPKGLKNSQHRLLNATNSLTKNGTWNVGGNVENLRLDELNHISRRASLAFDINNSSTTGFINNFTMTPVDISEFLNAGAEFNWLKLPIPLNMLSVQLWIGSSPTDYYSATVNQPHDNNAFTTGWNLLKYMLNILTVGSGIPNPTAINFLQLNFTTNGQAIPNCNIDSFVVRMGEVYQVQYNSQYCLIDSVNNAWKQYTTSPQDIITAEEDTYQILMLETALVEMKYIYGNNFGAETDVTGISADLNDAYAQYKLNHTDESISPTEDSYIVGDMYEGYSGDSLDSYGSDNDNCGDVTDNVNQNNNWC